jgi:hypothetical protein
MMEASEVPADYRDTGSAAYTTKIDQIRAALAIQLSHPRTFASRPLSGGTIVDLMGALSEQLEGNVIQMDAVRPSQASHALLLPAVI